MHRELAQQLTNLRVNYGVFIRAVEHHIEDGPLWRIGYQSNLLAGWDLRLLLGELNRTIDAAQLVHQPILFSLRSQPDPSLGDRLNLVVRALAAIRHALDEAFVEVVDLLAQFLALVVSQVLII